MRNLSARYYPLAMTGFWSGLTGLLVATAFGIPVTTLAATATPSGCGSQAGGSNCKPLLNDPTKTVPANKAVGPPVQSPFYNRAGEVNALQVLYLDKRKAALEEALSKSLPSDSDPNPSTKPAEDFASKQI